MALHDPKNTLAYHAARILTSHRDMRHVPCAQIAPAVDAYKKHDIGGDKTSPEREALWFYGLNHAVALISAKRDRYEPLTEWETEVVETYHAVVGPKAVRAFYYLLAICTKEFRHLKGNHVQTYADIAKTISPVPGTWFTHNYGSEQHFWNQFIASPPNCTIGQWVEALRHGFYHGTWGHAFGGKAWGKITDCLLRFVQGEYTAEMMMDTVWTLSHNTAPIFNKGHLYGLNGPKLQLLLDVQRSGQIPELILEGTHFSPLTDAKLVHLMGELRAAFPDQIGTHVDWFQVEALGSIGSYATLQAKQVAAHGASPAQAQLQAKKAAAQAVQQALQDKHNAAQAAAKKAQAQAAAAEAKTHFLVMAGHGSKPALKVKKIQVARAA